MPTAIHVTMLLTLGGTWEPDDFHDRVATFADELMSVESGDPDLTDTSIDGDSGESTVEVEMTVLTDDALDAIMKAATAARTAIHALGGSTSRWPNYQHIIQALNSASIATEPALIAA